MMHRLLAPVEPTWLDAVRAVAAQHKFASFDAPARLGASVLRLSSVYNDPAGAGLRSQDAALLEARLSFWLVRDLPKVTTAARELMDAGLLRLSTKPLRVLDLGAGLGASTFGLTRALCLAGEKGTVDALLVDDDRRALALATEVAREIGKTLDVQLHLRTLQQHAPSYVGRERFDVILLGQVVSELDSDVDPIPRVQKHAAWIARLMQTSLADDGCLIIVEPALRDRTRHLHGVRDALMADKGITLFAPCLHREACPMLEGRHDWCHEDLFVDLPESLIAVARAAGLRFEGLTYAYLVLRRDGLTLRSRLPTHASLARIVSTPLVTKGKREWFLCGDAMSGGSLVSGKIKAMRLDRERAPHNIAWDEASRGDVLGLSPPLEHDRPRLSKEGSVAIVHASFDTES